MRFLNLRTLRICLLLYAGFDLFFGGACGGFFDLATAAAAQFTTVTGTVTDPNGLPYANGTITAQLVLTGVTPTLNGNSFSMSASAGLNPVGKFVMQLADSNTMSPSLQWSFTVCSGFGTIQPAGGTGPQCFTPAPITITGATQDISTQLQAAALALSAAGAGLPAGVGAGSACVSNGVGKPCVYQPKPVKDVRDFGTVGDGVTDDRAAIIATLAACSGSGGKVILPPPPVSYFVSNSITATGSCAIEGQGGASITIPSAGWLMVAGTGMGIINIKSVNNVRVTGLHIIGNGAGGADINHTPKLVYFEAVNNVQIDHNELESSGCEAIWNGGSQTANTNIDVGDNYLHDDELQSAFSSCNLLPAIQMNADYAIVHDNRLKNVGTGIGFSAGHGAVTGNVVQNPALNGISTGDSGVNGPISVSGNVVDVTATGANAYNFDGGSGLDTAVQVSSNQCYAHGGAAITQECYRIGTATRVNFAGNFATVNYRGTCFDYRGSTAGTFINSSGNTCQGQSETAAITGFFFQPNGGGQTLTVNSSGDQVYGITRANGSSAFSTTGLSGTLNLTITGDVQSQGNNGFISNSSGQLDGQPFNFYGPGLTAANPPLTPASTFSFAQGGGQFYTAGTSGLFQSTVCFSADNTVSKCGLGATNPIGQAIGAPGAGGGLAVQTHGYSNQVALYDATVSPSAGWYACTSAITTGKVTAQAAACPAGRQVGIIPVSGTNVTSGSVIFGFGTGVAPILDCGATSTCAVTSKTPTFTVRGSVAFPTATTVTVTALPFTSAASYSCTAGDATTAAGVINATTYTSGSSVTFTETGGVNTDTIRYVCVGF